MLICQDLCSATQPRVVYHGGGGEAFTPNHRQKLEDDPDTQEINGAFEAASCYLENP